MAAMIDNPMNSRLLKSIFLNIRRSVCGWLELVSLLLMRFSTSIGNRSSKLNCVKQSFDSPAGSPADTGPLLPFTSVAGNGDILEAKATYGRIDVIIAV
jgi:hypothetical protein